MKIAVAPRTFHFRQPAGTSRGVYTTRTSWFLTITDPSQPHRCGIGECAPLPDLSCDASDHYAATLRRMCDMVEATGQIPYDLLRPYPSMLFGLETAMLHFQRATDRLFDTPFSRGEEGIPINGLVWMGSYGEMLQRIDDKLRQGFRCVKLKIGAIDFASELHLLRLIRQRFSPSQIELRVDANGAFSPSEAPERLHQLAEFGLHSIEQPIRQGQWQAMARLCRETPLPIALDEELIGVNLLADKVRLLDTIRPQYIILKPSLHGGMLGCQEWIDLARQRGIGSWITSALESNVGLNAIAQFAAHTYGSAIDMPQGLGTGALFTDNVSMPLEVRRDELWCNPAKPFADEWTSPSPTLTLSTSGSTGQPKSITVQKSRMQASALATCRFLGLKRGDSALLCLSTHFIAGKMMVVRALTCGLRLTAIAPTAHPLSGVGRDGFDFAAMVPLQVSNSLSRPDERERLSRIRHLIIGGGAIDESLEQQLRNFPNAIWSTYGMTETLSHIAMRRVSGPDASLWYEPLPGVGIGLSADGCLTIHAPHVCEQPLVTNDLAELSADSRRFRILGRRDNVVCSGGLKIQLESLESTLRPYMPVPFLFTKCRDAALGEALVLLTQGGDEAQARALCQRLLPRHHQPRHILSLPRLPLTPTGKPARAEAHRLAAEALE